MSEINQINLVDTTKIIKINVYLYYERNFKRNYYKFSDE